jgi:hypothetical protein
MGMYDDVVWEAELPEGHPVASRSFQTKSLFRSLDRFTITKEGRLILHDYTYKSFEGAARGLSFDGARARIVKKFIGHLAHECLAKRHQSITRWADEFFTIRGTPVLQPWGLPLAISGRADANARILREGRDQQGRVVGLRAVCLSHTIQHVAISLPRWNWGYDSLC